MEAVELARRAAESLHRAALERGLDPWRPYEFAVAEAARREIDVEQTATGAAVLNGGRATFILKDRLILHEASGSEFEKAFLVAHELGHVELGDDNDPEPVRDIDPARAAEEAPIGFDSVIDYGRRQRREVQMDLFAREFLLPRSVARALHLDDGLTASQIAQRLGAPFDVVAQQLLDALLLPTVEPEIERQRVERPLNELQRAAADHRGVAYLLEAGPGTGKTQTLTARVEGLLDDGVDPRRILLLTFSNKAAGEMAERIARKRADAASAMWIGTFHAFGLDVIRRFHGELGLPHDPRMLDRTEAVELLEAEFPRLSLVHYRNLYDPTQIIADMLAAISRAKDEVVDASQYAALAGAMRQRAATPADVEVAEKAAEVAQVYAVYERLKAGAHCVDFGDLVSLPVRLLERDPAIRAHFQKLYDHVLVDEYQDVNRSSVRLLAALRGEGENLWAVGDAKQSIYRFRGASSFNMKRFGTEDFSGGERGRLKRNYRSVEEVVASFSAFAMQMAVGDRESALLADRGRSSANPEVRTADQADQATVALADTIEEMHAAGHAYRDQAVLCTGNERLARLAQELERLGVPVLFLGSLFERPEVRELLALCSILIDRRAMGLISVACWPDFAMPIEDVAAVLDHLRAAEQDAGAWLEDAAIMDGLTDQGRSAVSRLKAALEGFDRTSAPWVVMTQMLLDRTRMAARIASSTAVTDRTRGIALWQFLNFVRAQPRGQGLPIAHLLDRVRRLLRLGEDRDLRQLPAAAQRLDAVQLMTIHGSKGLEFPVVHIPGMNGDTLPRTPAAPACPPPNGMVAGGQGKALAMFRAGQAEEQECLFYVALSRARDRLFIYAPTQRADGANRPLSRFLDRLGSSLVRHHVQPSRALDPAPDAAGVELAIDGGLVFTGAQISLYESCPRRFFYTHILQVGGRRTQTAFMQMHEAVRSVFRGVIEDNGAIVDAELERQVAAACAAQGLADHGYRIDYEAFAITMLRYFVSIRTGHAPEEPVALSLRFGDEQIIVRPDDVLVRADGMRMFRRVQTGHHRSAESKDVGAAAFMLAVRQAFPGAVAELVHLSDQAIRPLTLTPKVLENNRGKLARYLAAIRTGAFPAEASARICPGCPAFFICGPTPSGVLRKSFG